MATRLKTVHYAFPALASLVNNTLTTLTQITLYLPENSKVFKKVIAHLTCDDIITATGGTLTTKTRNLRLGAAAYMSVANANTLTNSGENASFHISTDFTSHFVTNWSGTSMTCDFQVQINQSSGTTTGMVNVCVTLEITYEYDDTTTTHVKTVFIPLDAPVGALATTKPGTQNDVIPALDTYLPEASKTIRQIHVIVQGNMSLNGSTVDSTLSMQIDASGATITTGNHEAALASDRWFRFIWDLTGAFTTNATHNFFIWASQARYNHLQVYLVVTYEFDSSTTTSVMNSLMLPMEFASPMGGTTSSDYQRGKRELWIEESNIALSKLAFFMFWDQAAAISGLNMRIGSGSFVTYTDIASVLCGGSGCMIRNDSPSGISLARGRNSLFADVYRTDTADLGFNVSGFWIINYTSDKHSNGVGAHNHTVFWNLANTNTVAAGSVRDIAATAPGIPETDFFLNAVGTRYQYMSASTGNPAGVTVLVERLSGEGGIQWETAYTDIGYTDPEVGLRQCFSQMRSLFKRFPGDQDADRIDLETSRRWRAVLNNGCTSFDHIDVIFTYHSITFSVAGNISGFSGTVNVDLHRVSDGEKVKSTSRSGDGAYSFTWYDDTEQVFTVANDGTNKGVSSHQMAA